MPNLTDLEITKLCAEAMGLTVIGRARDGDAVTVSSEARYDPLHDDAQAMELVKKLELWIQRTNTGYWQVTGLDAGGFLFNTDLNRAICKCVARMQKEKNRG